MKKDKKEKSMETEKFVGNGRKMFVIVDPKTSCLTAKPDRENGMFHATWTKNGNLAIYGAEIEIPEDKQKKWLPITEGTKSLIEAAIRLAGEKPVKFDDILRSSIRELTSNSKNQK
jgi:hypothetical protein